MGRITCKQAERYAAQCRNVNLQARAAHWDNVDSNARRMQAIEAAQDFYQICVGPPDLGVTPTKEVTADRLGPALRTLQWLGELHGLRNTVEADGRQITVVFNRPEPEDEDDQGDTIETD